MKLSVKIVGEAPLIMHNGNLADPQNPYTIAKKKVTSKRKKVEADNDEVGRIEFIGSCYLDHSGKIYMPAKVLQGCLISGAKGLKNGRAAKAGIFVERNTTFKYTGPTDPQELYKNKDFVSREIVKQGQVRIVRVRPIFNEWEVEFQVEFLDDVTNKEEIKAALEHAGRFCGLGDWRPQHGRFTVKSIE